MVHNRQDKYCIKKNIFHDGSLSCSSINQNLHASRKAKFVVVNDLTLPFELVLELNNCYFVSALSRNIIYISCLNLNGFRFVIENNKLSIFGGDISYDNGCLMNGLYILNIELSLTSLYIILIPINLN